MSTLNKQMALWSSQMTHPPLSSYDVWHRLAHHRLNAVFQSAPVVAFDDTTRLVFFSDCHRGDNSRADAFSANESLFLHALRYYYEQGFTYIEVGDGDELWKNRQFNTVRIAHGLVFDCLHRFDEQQRLHLLFGNHDIGGALNRQMHKDGMIAREGLILRQSRTGQEIFVVHGHQADFKSDACYPISRMAVRRIWRRLQLWGLAPVSSPNPEDHAPHAFERFLLSWAALNRHLLICGHTHRAAGAIYGEPPYFNTGHCFTPGVMTGLEIQNGEIVQMRWRATPFGAAPFRRETLAAPRRIGYFQGAADGCALI